MSGQGKWIPYSDIELQWIKDHCTLPRREAHALFCKKFERSDVSVQNLNCLCKRKRWRTGRNGQFPPGSVSWNKGKKMPYNAHSAQTQFKKGGVPPNTKYLGHERISKDGYIEISVAQRNPHTGYERRYVLKHKYLWEKENGPVPAGMCLKCKDGNRLNTDPSNWMLIHRGILLRLNGSHCPNFQSADPEVRPVIMTLAKLIHILGTAKHQREGNRGHHDKP